MKLTLAPPQFFQGQGRRDYQQDHYKISESGRYFIVCDGMGGHLDGELAAQTVCCALAAYFETTPPKDFVITTEYFDKAINYAYDQLDKNDPHPYAFNNMGTTMTCVYFGDNGALVAHCGDSRIYQIRPKYYLPGNCKTATILETKDHSYVQELIDKGQITKEQAKTHPDRNIITKCMTANSDRDMPEYNSCSVMDGDYFFLCSDGILENITTEILCSVLALKISDEDKIKKLFAHCDNKTRDNFTAVLIHVQDGYLPAIIKHASPTPAAPYDPEKSKKLIDKINEFLGRKK